MKSFLILIFLMICPSAFAQKTFEIKDASTFFDIKIVVAKCEDQVCSGKATFSIYRKGSKTPYQIINLNDTYVGLDENENPTVNTTLLYDIQSAVNVGDFNFDGMEDIALCNVANGSYGMLSYSVYLSSRAARKFVYNAAFSALASKLGFFDVDREKKILRTFDKSGCCWHKAEEYSVVNNRPRNVLEVIDDALIPDETRMKITTRRLVSGKWKTSVKYVSRVQ